MAGAAYVQCLPLSGLQVLTTILQIATVIAAFAGLGFSIVALRRTEAAATRERFLSGPVPVVSVFIEHRPEGGSLKITVENRGRAAFTMRGGGFAFQLRDGGLRHICVGDKDDIRVDPEAGPRGYLIPGALIRHIVEEVGRPGDVRPFIWFGSSPFYGHPPLPVSALEDLVLKSGLGVAAAADETFSIFDAFYDHSRTAKLRPTSLPSDGPWSGETRPRYGLTDVEYHALIQLERRDEP